MSGASSTPKASLDMPLAVLAVAPAPQRSALRSAVVTLTVSTVTTMNVFLSGALTIAIPTIGRDLGFTEATLQWPVAVYSLACGCLLLFLGRVADILSPRVMFLGGAAWCAAFSIGAAFAPSSIAFTVFMALLGIGAAANTPAAIGLLIQHFPPGPAQNRALGVLGAFQPIGWILGLILGGVLSGSKATWRSIFYIEAALITACGALGWFVFEPERQERHRYAKGLDWGGAVLSTVSIGLLTFSLSDAASAPRGWATPRVPALLAVSLVLLIAFSFYESYREKRQLSVILPPSMWRRPKARMPAMITIVFFGWWSFNAFLYWSTIYFQNILRLSPFQTAVRFIPGAFAGISTTLLGGFLMNKVRGNILMFVGLLGNVIAPLIFSLVDQKTAIWAIPFIALLLCAGADVIYPIGTVHLTNSFEEDSQSLAGGVFNVAVRLGTALGLAVTSTIATSLSRRYHSAHPWLEYTSPEVLMVGYRAVGWACVAAAAIAALVVLLGMRGIGIVGARKTEVVVAVATAMEAKGVVEGKESQGSSSAELV